MQQDIVEDFSWSCRPVGHLVVRFYGETTNPATGSVDARAYGEAVPCTVSDFMDSSVSPERNITTRPPPSDGGPKITCTTDHAGNRELQSPHLGLWPRFRIVSIRWLSANDI